jgi:acyl-CoA synthetase (NDP forming)
VAALICPITGAGSMANRLAKDLVVKAEEHGKPVFVVWGSPVGTEVAYTEILLNSALPLFRTFGNCVAAVRAYFDYHAFAARYASPWLSVPTQHTAARAGLLPILQPGSALSEHASKRVLAEYGISVTDDTLATDAAEALSAAKQIAGPVALKVCSPDLLHKSDLGLVQLAVSSPSDVQRGYDELLARARDLAPQARIEGVLVSPMVDKGVEMVVGVSTDPLFGPVVMLGLGGVHVEVLGDVTHRVPPYDAAEAERMLGELRARALLDGIRGRAAADKAAVVDVLMKVQRLALDLADNVSELDINPLVVGPDGAVALDALVVCR